MKLIFAIVQNDDSWNFVKQFGHVTVEGRITEVIEHGAVAINIVAKPVRGAKLIVATARRRTTLFNDDVDLVVLGQNRQQFSAVIGNACFSGWHRRNIGQAWTLIGLLRCRRFALRIKQMFQLPAQLQDSR